MVSRVYVWDLDETLIIFQTLSNGKYAEQFKGLKDSRYGIKLGRRWEKLIIQVCDDHFFYEQIEDYNEPTLESWRKYDDGLDISNYDFASDGLNEIRDEANNRKLAYRHRHISYLYSNGLDSLLGAEQLQEWHELYELTDAYTDGWLTAGRFIQLSREQKIDKRPLKISQILLSMQGKRVGLAVYEAIQLGGFNALPKQYFVRSQTLQAFQLGGSNALPKQNVVMRRRILQQCLEPSHGGDLLIQENASICSASSSVNVLVTSGNLVPSIVKCLLFRLDRFFGPKDVYSSAEVGKTQCCRWIKERYDNIGVKFCVIGDGLDECDAAQALGWPFLRVDTKPDGHLRLPLLSLPIIESYMNVIYGSKEDSEIQQ